MTEPSPNITMAVRAALALFFVVCLCLGYEIDSANHLGVTHVATAGLLVFALAIALWRRKATIRKPWGTRWDRILIGLASAYLVLRLMQSIGNEFFFGQAFKIILIVAGIACYKILDPDGRSVRYFAGFLPAVLAIMVAVGMALFAVSGKIGVERFKVGPNEYEYVSEYGCLMLPLALLFLDEGASRKKKRLMYAAMTVIMAGLVLTASRGALVGSAIAIVAYGYLSKHRWRAVALLCILGTLYVVLGPVAFGAGAGAEIRVDALSSELEGGGGPEGGGGGLLDENALNRLLSGRVVHWMFEYEEVTSRTDWIIFGSGLGRFAEWVEDPGFYRPGITNALLAAWVPFGIFGLLAYLYLYRYTWRRITRVEDGPYRWMAISLLLAYIFTDQFETHWQGTKMLWYVSYVGYLLMLARPKLANVSLARARRNRRHPSLPARAADPMLPGYSTAP
jgi:hypothetical protein